MDLRFVVCDYNGTLALDGKIKTGVAEKFNQLFELGYKIYVITADTHGSVRQNIKDLCDVHVLQTAQHDVEKARFVEELGREHVAAFGNGLNDRHMLKSAALGIAVLQEEGLAVETMISAKLMVRDINEGLNLLINPSRVVASLRLS